MHSDNPSSAAVGEAVMISLPAEAYHRLCLVIEAVQLLRLGLLLINGALFRSEPDGLKDRISPLADD